MTEGLFPAPEPVDRELSRFWSGLRCAPDDTPRWGTNTLPLPCDECFAEQHEGWGTQKRWWPRHWASHTRTIRAPTKRGSKLYLCHIHADLWRKKDMEDRA